MNELVYCLNLDDLALFLSMLPFDMWAVLNEPFRVEVYTEQAGTVTWMYYETAQEFCHDGFS